MDELLAAFFSATEQNTIIKAAQDLSRAGNSAHVPVLLGALQDPIESRRWGALHNFQCRKDKRIATPVIRVLLDSAETIWVRGQAAEVLARERTSKAIWPLIETTRAPSAELRFWSVFALGQQGCHRRSAHRTRKIIQALEARLEDHLTPEYWLDWTVDLEALAAIEHLDEGHYSNRRFHTLMQQAFDDPFEYPELWRWARFYHAGQLVEASKRANKVLKIAGFDPGIFPGSKPGGAKLTPRQAAKLPFFV